MIHVGTAGWTVPRAVASRFSEHGSGLERYAGSLGAAEINSSFQRPHKPETYARWAAAVPDAFRFGVKLPKTITHERRLVEAGPLLEQFLDEISALGAKLGPLLIQLPPSFAFSAEIVGPFLDDLRQRVRGPVACEPRHPTWFEEAADRLLAYYQVARAAADPARVPEAAVLGGWPGLVYYRLHGSPRTYASEYSQVFLAQLSGMLQASTAAERWCIFDNTLLGAAAGNALDLAEQVAVMAPGANR